MTDLSHAFRDEASLATATARRPWPLLPYVCVFAAAAAGLYVGRSVGGDTSVFEDKLLLLLRFMAAMKLAAVFAGAALTHWRFGFAIDRLKATAYLASLAAMGAAGGLIWSLGAIALGAILFHAGLLAFLVLAWKDEGVRLPVRR